VKVISFVKGINVYGNLSDDKINIIINSDKPINVRKVTSGIGVYWFYRGGKRSNYEFLMLESYKYSEYNKKMREITIEIPNKHCVGFVKRESWKGVIIAPSVKIDVAMGIDIIISCFLPRKTLAKVNVEKKFLEVVDNSAKVILSFDSREGEIISNLNSNRGNYRKVKIFVQRHFYIFPFNSFFHEQLIEEFKPGEIKQFSFKPVARKFDPFFIVLNPYFSVGEILKILEALGAPIKKWLFFKFLDAKDFVIGDGSPINTNLKLVVDFPLGLDKSDSTKIFID